MESSAGTRRAAASCAFVAIIVLLACFPRLAVASSVSLSVFTPNCGTQTRTSESSVAFSHSESASPGCVSGDDIAVQVEATLTSVGIFIDSLNTDRGSGVMAFILDRLTVSGGAGRGTLLMDVGVTGTLFATDTWRSTFLVYAPLVGGSPPVGEWNACGANTHGGLSPCATNWGPTTSVDEVIRLSIPFDFNVPFNTQLNIQVNAGPNFSLSGSSPGTGTVDFFNTAKMLPLVVLDGSGNQVAGATARSDSGFIYTMADAPVPVPEPVSLLLLAAGWAGLSGRRRRR